jgi:hypothetical protein
MLTGLLNYQAALLYGDDGTKVALFGKLSLVARLALGLSVLVFLKYSKAMLPVILLGTISTLAICWWFTLGDIIFIVKNTWYIILSALVAAIFYFRVPANA